ncbi:phosphatidylserine synthase [Marinomonas sp. MED121]|uniref:CDP-diacylglycerol--serine O-phosphatidyltransferase n=1 Tax=Marinomonas sp. MED121 TaxID=314277 RepID=UPI0000690FDA|nr:CDP-diacylglycerol--serine O-phosphatidyltransferase [Marinomonas sp. MED121]EAQ67472.1 phosphatidylserine synthase [Marinomonas sp. MED121]
MSKVTEMPIEKKAEPIDENLSNDDKASVKPPHKGIYLLPNLFTTAALFAGFYAIIAAMNGDFIHASVAIFIAMILDGLDGRVARMTGTQSAFGAEYDSLSDMVSFGVAPALISFTWVLSPLGKIGWVAAFIYVVGAALRLARFNTMLGVEEKRYFTGLPSPAAAAIIAGIIWAANSQGVAPDDIKYLMAFVVPAVGLLMVSNVKYRSFKDLNMKGKVSFIKLVAVVLLLVLVTIEPDLILASVFVIYGLSGLIGYMMRKLS